MNGILKRYILWTYGIFYVFLLLIGISMLVIKSQPLAEVLKVLSAWTATIVFVAMFRKIKPQENLMDFIKGQFRARIRLSMVLSVILLQLFVLIGSLSVVTAVWNVPIREQLADSWTTLLLVFGYNLILGPLGEELGWSAFVLDELQKKFSPLTSALIVGVTWGFWHAPLWLMTGFSGMDLVLYIVCFLVSIISVSIMITEFYNLNHNLMIPILIHQLFNYFMGIQLGEPLRIIVVTAPFYLIVAVGLVVVNDRKCLYK